MTDRLKWADVPILLAAEEATSLAMLGEMLRMDPTTVSRRITSMERDLGVTVFTRSRGTLALTPAGRRLLTYAQAMEAAAKGLEHEARAMTEEPAGTVHVSAPPTFSHTVLGPNLPVFLKDYPGIQVDVSVDRMNVAIGDWEADVAIRLGATTPDEDNILTRKLGEMPYSVFGPADGADQPRWIAYPETFAHVPEAAWQADRNPEADIAARCNDPVSTKAMVAAGAGLAVLPDALCHGDATVRKVEDRILVRDVWLLRHRASLSSYPTQLLVDWIAGMARRVLSGGPPL